MMSPVMAEEGDTPGLVDRSDTGEPVAEIADHKVGVIGEPADDVAVLPAAGAADQTAAAAWRALAADHDGFLVWESKRDGAWRLWYGTAV